MAYLSKSDFKVAQSCITKLYYKKMRYPTPATDDGYLELLAEGGYMVGKLAQLLYPDGVEVKTEKGTPFAINETKEYLKSENITLFEAAIESNGKLIRIDVLVKKGNVFQLIEVKSKSWDSGKPPKPHEIKEYLEDVAFQTMVLREAYPDASVIPYLFLPDKAKRTTLDGLNGMFSIKRMETQSSTFKSYDVTFNGDPQLLLTDDIMTLVDVSKEVDKLMPAILQNSKIYLESLAPELHKIESQIAVGCKFCEYTDPTKNGFHECWGDLATADKHVLQMSHVGNFNRKGEIDSLILERKVSISDVPVELVLDKYNNRAYYQRTKSAEWVSKEFRSAVNGIRYPIHFIDFETSRMAIPYHKGMRPYENIAFQWSCHTLKEKGGELSHSEWINVSDGFPNFEFAKSLMDTIKLEGSFMMWATHENTVLRDIYYQMEEYGYSNQKLWNWLSSIIKFDKGDSGRFIDMNRMTLDHYFHPSMKGRTSIKVTLPAVLKQTKSEKIASWLKSFSPGIDLLHYDENGGIQNPYDFLPTLEFVEDAEKVKDGTGAMRAYQEMLYGLNKGNADIKDEWMSALLRYCKLDTLAMAIIWEHWNDIIDGKSF